MSAASVRPLLRSSCSAARTEPTRPSRRSRRPSSSPSGRPGASPSWTAPRRRRLGPRRLACIRPAPTRAPPWPARPSCWNSWRRGPRGGTPPRRPRRSPEAPLAASAPATPPRSRSSASRWKRGSGGRGPASSPPMAWSHQPPARPAPTSGRRPPSGVRWPRAPTSARSSARQSCCALLRSLVCGPSPTPHSPLAAWTSS
mmetsp:Transcript_25284/g.84438  ORF Transcript_25284/g.84438 Transcript_25284/m.84438 type:complete len:200 (-) Transcript_25284:894-1493(-)